MITKDTLKKDRDQSNVAYLRIMQNYKKSEKKVYLVVEGKDDCAYYRCISIRYATNGTEFEVIPANKRINVIKSHSLFDWSFYSKKRIFMFVDRDLSDITKEFTPEDGNVYVTDDYSIENSLFTEELIYVALQAMFGLVDISDEERAEISRLYNVACQHYRDMYLPIMCWVLHWRKSGYSCNLNNLNTVDFFYISEGRFAASAGYSAETRVAAIHRKCGVIYQETDLSSIESEIEEHGGFNRLIRGKYLRLFFVRFLNSIASSFSSIFPSRSDLDPVVTIGYSNAVQILCGYMRTPKTLDDFMLRIAI